MTELVQALLVQFEKEAMGILGGAIFFGSWLLQAWESRRNGAPVVSMRFFVLRALASFLLMFEGIRSGSFSITFLMFATLLLMLYNVHLIWKKNRSSSMVS